MGQRLLISVRGPKEAKAADEGGAHIIDVEYPASALGTPYPLNILAVRNIVSKNKPISTNIGEEQNNWSSAAQAALGVAVSGADIIKIGLGRLYLKDAIEIGKRITRNVKWWFPKKQVIVAFFADPEMRKFIEPITVAKHMQKIGINGILLDTYEKFHGMGLTKYYSFKEISTFVKNCHKNNLEAWIAGSITIDEMSPLWKTGVNVICIRGSACEKNERQRGKINSNFVKFLKNTLI
jgi:hypothetical protein